MVKTKRNQVFDNKKIGNVLKKLAKLPKKEKTEFSLRETIVKLKDQLNRALDRGYSHEDLSIILEEQEIYVSVNMLKQYLREANNLPELPSSDGENSPTQQEQKNTVSATESANNSAGESLHRHPGLECTDNKLDNKFSAKNKTANKNKSPKSPAKIQETVAENSVLSGYSEDLSGDFNQY